MILIVGNHVELSELWARHIQRLGLRTKVVVSQEEAVECLSEVCPSGILLDLMLSDGSAMAVADYASYRHPSVPVVFVSCSRFFSDGSIFSLIQNAAALVPENTSPADIAEILAYHGRADVSAA